MFFRCFQLVDVGRVQSSIPRGNEAFFFSCRVSRQYSLVCGGDRSIYRCEVSGLFISVSLFQAFEFLYWLFWFNSMKISSFVPVFCQCFSDVFNSSMWDVYSEFHTSRSWVACVASVPVRKSFICILAMPPPSDFFALAPIFARPKGRKSSSIADESSSVVQERLLRRLGHEAFFFSCRVSRQ